ncbi:PadR family transcriptional regulator [Pseudonocardia benzenivorans]
MELGRSDRDLPALTVLGLLTLGPRHTYEMHRMMIDYHKDFVTGLPRSMYHAVERLLRDGHIRVVETVREGAAPNARSTTSPTTAVPRSPRASVGCSRYRTTTPPSSSQPCRSSGACRYPKPSTRCTNASSARREPQDGGAVLDATRGVLPRILLVEAEFTLARVTAEHEFVTGLVADLASGALDPTEVGDMPSRP